jgi:hypothetical protein
MLPDDDPTTVELLRLLGRLELAQTPVLRALVFPTVSPRTMYYRLAHLTQRRYLWMERVAWNRTPAGRGTGRRPPPRQPQVWGLTPRGRDLLRDLGVEPDPHSLASLKTRDLRQKPLSPLTLTHDLLASWWCAACLLSLRDNALVRSVFCQVEFISHARQRIDALLMIRLRAPGQPRPADELGRIPWFDGTNRRNGEIELRLALEVDRGTEQLVTLLEKAICYRDLHADGTYTRTLGGPVLPVFLVPPGRRGGQIAREWQDAWEDGWGVSATVEAADHPQHGPLWGRYQSMRMGDKARPLPLLTRLVVTSVGKVQFHPTVTLEQWLQHSRYPIADTCDTTEEQSDESTTTT